MSGIVIDLNEGLYWDDCPMCGHYRRLDHAVGWYCGPVKEDIGQPVAEWGGEIAGGMSVCRVCHDIHYGEESRNQKPPAKEASGPAPSTSKTASQGD